jgi:Abortive infection C-terminus
MLSKKAVETAEAPPRASMPATVASPPNLARDTKAAQARILNAVARVVGDILGAAYYSHRALDLLFLEHAAPGDPPDGNCADKCTAWLKRASEDNAVDAYEVLGGVLEDFMESRGPRYPQTEAELEKDRQRIRDILGRFGMSYHPGGRVLGKQTGSPTRSLDTLLRAKDLQGVEVEFNRALENVSPDPAAAVTAACAIVEALCKIYIHDEALDLPAEQTIKPLWKVVQKHLGLDPAQMEDDDLKRILSGLSSVVDGLGALRTHIGSAHGRGTHVYKVEPRHARLAVHSAHSLTAFVIETWEQRRPPGTAA